MRLISSLAFEGGGGTYLFLLIWHLLLGPNDQLLGAFHQVQLALVPAEVHGRSFALLGNQLRHQQTQLATSDHSLPPPITATRSCCLITCRC